MSQDSQAQKTYQTRRSQLRGSTSGMVSDRRERARKRILQRKQESKDKIRGRQVVTTEQDEEDVTLPSVAVKHSDSERSNGVIKLQLCDSVHDFFKKRAQNASEEEEGVNTDVFETTKDHLTKLLEKTIGIIKSTNPDISPGILGVNINDILKSLSNDNNNSNIGSATSSFELNTEMYFETHPKYGKFLIADNKIRISYQDIIENLRTSQDLSSYFNDPYTQRVLEIYDDPDKTPRLNDILYDNTLTNMINTFIIGYMKGGLLSSDGAPQLYITFDAGGKYIKKLMFNDQRVYNMLTPQNIADSATTSFNQLGDRVEYTFPHFNKDGSKVYNVKSDVFNKNNGNTYQIVFEDNDFSDKNPYGFDVIFYDTTEDTKKATIDFNKQNKDGPSVNYLSSIIAGTSVVNPPKNSIAKIEANDTVIKTLVDTGTIYDIKRMGDYEQATAAKIITERESRFVILATLDRLCGLHARLIGQPCIFHNNEVLTLYRHPITLDPVEQLFSEYYFKVKECYTILQTSQWVEPIYNDIDAILTRIQEIIREGFILDLNLSKQLYKNPKMTFITRSAYTIVYYLLLLKYKDMLNQLVKFKTSYDTIKSTLTQTINDVITQTNAVTQTDTLTYITSLLEDKTILKGIIKGDDKNKEVLDTTINSILDLKKGPISNLEKAKANLNISFDNDGNPYLDTFVGKFNDTERTLKLRGSNSNLELYLSVYRSTFESLKKVFTLIENTKLSERLGRNKVTLYDAIVKTGFFDNSKKITQFYDFGETVSNIIIVEKSNDDEAIINGFKNMSNNLLALEEVNWLRGIKFPLPSILMEYSEQYGSGKTERQRRTLTGTDPYTPGLLTQRRMQQQQVKQLQQQQVQQQRLYGDFSEILFGAMARCSEFYKSILYKSKGESATFFKYINTNLFKQIVPAGAASGAGAETPETEDDLSEEIKELYEDCSMYLRNNFDTIEQYSKEYGDAYTYDELDTSFIEKINFLFLYNDNQLQGTEKTTVDSLPQTREGKQALFNILIKTSANDYSDIKYFGHDTSIGDVGSNTAAAGTGSDISLSKKSLDIPFDNNFTDILYDLYTTNVKDTIVLYITLSFALMYDLYSEKLYNKSDLKEIYDQLAGGRIITSITNRYDTTVDINEKLFKNIHMFINLINYKLQNPTGIIPQPVKNLIGGGKKKKHKYTRKKIKKHNKKTKNNNKRNVHSKTKRRRIKAKKKRKTKKYI